MMMDNAQVDKNRRRYRGEIIRKLGFCKVFSPNNRIVGSTSFSDCGH